MDMDAAKEGVVPDSSHEEEYLKIREELISIDRKDYFTIDVPELTENEIKASKVLDEMREKMSTPECSPHLMGYYEGYKIVKDSDLYQKLFEMPKGAHLHYHLTAAAHIDFLIELTKEDWVYYNATENRIKIFTGGNPTTGYKQWNILRDNWDKDGSFDDFIRSKILLTNDDISSKYSNEIWKKFQFKFDMTYELYNYHKFFKRILTSVLKNAVEERVSIISFKHIFGCLIDDLGQSVDVETEIGIFNECLKEVPEVNVKLVVCGLKIFGEDKIQQQMHYWVDNIEKTNLIAGFDLVCEEDTTPPLKTFKSIIKKSQEKYKNLKVLFHAGESTSRKNDNLYDAILLGTRRIGHGLAIANHPHLMEELKKEQIWIELCPISNLLLGYTLDLRWHPGKFLLQRGVPVCISADDPGFWGIQGVTLDYAYATLAWELDLRDLKQLVINSIKYCDLASTDKEDQMKVFNEKWTDWVNSIIE